MLIERLRLKTILSFRDATIELGPLNVLIGPNGVGKSNLIEVIGLLQALPAGLSNGLRIPSFAPPPATATASSPPSRLT